MDFEVLAPMFVATVFILTVGGVVILRPITSRLSELLALYATDRTKGMESELHHVRDLLETVNARMELMEDRLDFTERLLEPPREAAKTDPPASD